MKTTPYPPIHCNKPMQPVEVRPHRLGPQQIPAQLFKCRNCPTHDVVFTFQPEQSQNVVHILRSDMMELIAATADDLKDHN